MMAYLTYQIDEPIHGPIHGSIDEPALCDIELNEQFVCA